MFKVTLVIDIVRWIMQRLVLHPTPVIARYLERGGVATLSMVAIWFAQAVHRIDEMKPLQLNMSDWCQRTTEAALL